MSKNRGKNKREEPALQLTSYQLVMAICALLLLMCVLFLAGILVQRFNESGQRDRVATTNSEPTVRDTARTAAPTPKTEGVQVAPRPVELPPQGERADMSSSSRDSAESDAKFIPAPPPRRNRKHQSAESAAVEDKKAETVESTPISAPEEPSKPTPVAVPGQSKEQLTTPPSSEPTRVAANTQEGVATFEPVPAAEEDKGPFTIQLASFDANNLERAKEFKEDIEKNSDFTVNLVPSSDGKHIRAYAGEYEDRASAERVRDSMRKIEDFKDCFVKSMAEE